MIQPTGKLDEFLREISVMWWTLLSVIEIIAAHNTSVTVVLGQHVGYCLFVLMWRFVGYDITFENV